MSQNVERLKDFIKVNCKVGDRLDIKTGSVAINSRRIIEGGLPGFDFVSTPQAVRSLEKSGILEVKPSFRFFEVIVRRIP